MNNFITPRSGVSLRHLLKVVLACVLASACSIVSAQTVGTIGIADITYKGPKQQLWADANVVAEVASSLNSAFVLTRKFTVLDLPQVKNRLSGQGLTLEGFYAKEYKSTELLQAGLDYILTADITKFSSSKRTGENAADTQGLVNIEFRLLGVADVTSDFESSVAAKMNLTVAANAKFDSANLMREAIKQATTHLVEQVVTTLHPIRLMQITDEGLITLNYGNGFLEAEDTVLVYPLDQVLTLDNNGKIIGEPVGKLKITSVRRKFSSAQAVDGFASLEKGQAAQLVLRTQ